MKLIIPMDSDHAVALKQLSVEKDMSVSAIVRHAVRLYQYREAMIKLGYTEMEFCTPEGVKFKKPSKMKEDLSHDV